jgi:hypothetical protein
MALEAAKVQGSPYPLVIPAGSVGYESLTVLASSQVVLQGPAEIVLGSLTLEGSAQLSFDTSQGPVRLYVLNGLDLAPGSLLTTSSTNPDDVYLQIPGETATPARLRSSGSFRGVVYAPLADVVLGSGFELFGALVADSLVFEGAARLHFDRNLSKLAAEDSLPVMLSWRLIEVGNLHSVSADPFDHLGLDPSTLPVPAGAHADQLLEIHYYDASNVYHHYEGLESEFDWNVVKTVIDGMRDGVPLLLPRAPARPAGAIKSPGVAPVVDGPMI